MKIYNNLVWNRMMCCARVTCDRMSSIIYWECKWQADDPSESVWVTASLRPVSVCELSDSCRGGGKVGPATVTRDVLDLGILSVSPSNVSPVAVTGGFPPPVAVTGGFPPPVVVTGGFPPPVAVTGGFPPPVAVTGDVSPPVGFTFSGTRGLYVNGKIRIESSPSGRTSSSSE